MFLPIKLSWLFDLFSIDISSLTNYEKYSLLILLNILFFVSFKFFYNIIKDIVRALFRTIRSIFK